jgi:tight adherence protein C
MPLLIAALVFFGFAVSTLGLVLLLRARDERRQILAKVGYDEAGAGFHDGDLPTRGNGLKGRAVRLAHVLGRAAKPKTEGDTLHLRALFMRAGLGTENAIASFFGAKVLLAVLFPLCLLLARVTAPLFLGPAQLFAAAVMLAAVGFYIPNLWLTTKIARRKEKMLAGFPDALDLLVVCTEAGLGLDAALRRVGAEMKFSNAVVSDEFGMLNLELKAGKSRADALRNLASRTAIEDMNSLATLLIQTDRFGTSVGQALRMHAELMRTRRAQKAEEMAAKLPVKLLFPTVFFIFPSVLLVILGPALIQAFRGLGQ